MQISVGIVGLPNVGKSTLFNALTKKSVACENYPFCTIDPSVGVVGVPDERLWKLSDFSKSEKTIPAAILFVDIAGLVAGAHKGEGLGNKFLANIRETDAILELVRIFPLENQDGITHVYGEIDPLRDIKVINMELILADLETIEKRIGNISRDLKKGDKKIVFENALLQKLKTTLENENMAYSMSISKEEALILKSLNLLTAKKFLYGLNKKSGVKNLDETNKSEFKQLTDWINESNAEYVIFDAKTEQDLKDFEAPEKNDMRREFGINDDGVNNLLKGAYKLLGLQTFFTTGEKESRAWTTPVGATAPEAGAAIHTDFQNKFIRADIINWQTLLDSGSWGKARDKGLIQTVGKDYIVQDGDVIIFKI